MVKERAAVGVGREVARALQIFARTARARQLYAPNNAILRRMIDELTQAFNEALKVVPELTIKVRPEALLFDDEVVLDEPNPEQSIPFVYFRDGIRRLDFARGLEPRELQILLDATAQGFNFSGFGDDIVARLWHHDLEHLRYLVLDTTIVAAGKDPGAPPAPGDYDLDAQIDGLLREIYGDSSDDVGPKSLHVDRSDLAAKAIAETLDAVEELAPGFHPPRAFLQPPAYAWDAREKVQSEGESELALGTATAAIAALSAPLPDGDLSSLADGLLRIFDAALVNREIKLATKIVHGVRRLEGGPAEARARRWLAEGVSDTRLRQVVQIYQSLIADDDRHAIMRFFRVCGPTAVPSLLGMLPSFGEQAMRRRFADVALEIGFEDLGPIQELVTSEQAFVAEEGIYLLAQIGTEPALAMLSAAASHERAEVRMAALTAADKLPPQRLQALAAPLLDDPEPKIKAAAARAFARVRSPDALATIERYAVSPELEREAYEVKRAFLVAYALLAQVRAISVLANYVKRGDGLLAKKEIEDLGVAAAEALVVLRTPRTVEVLKKAVGGRSKRIRETARAALLRMKEGK
jgi:HEAT repeat protein